jgi:hypothetical protein
MLEIKNTEVFNFEGAIRGMRNPLESWEKIDSFEDEKTFKIGESDLKLMKKLVKAGSDHRKFLRQIMVSFDVVAPLYWYKEMDTYKIATVANSTSTMHFLHRNEIKESCFSFEDVNVGFINDFFKSNKIKEDYISLLENLRKEYIKTKDKKIWRSLIQLLPNSFNQTRTITLNYEVLLNMYKSRKSHKLTEWHTFCDWIETLPYFKEICLRK